MTKREEPCWVIEGYDSTERIFHTKFKASLISLRQLKELLKTLTAQAGLKPEEIVGCYVMKHTKMYRTHLEVRRENDVERRRTNYYCGDNPHFVARIVRE